MTERDEIWIGFDTGGTYTDAVALAAGDGVIATAKALTTHWDLAQGLGNAIRALLERLPAQVRRERITLVSVSTTLATNAVVENRFSAVCTLLIGFDERMTEASGLRRAGSGALVRIGGGHDATGVEACPLDEAAIEAAVREHSASVEAFAVAALFSVRNPDHERRARDCIRRLCGLPVTCSHELSSQLDAPRRALTAALNARLTPQIRHLLDALGSVLAVEGIAAPLMIVKGDGTLMRADVALDYPVETVLSGPAASVVGAGFLCGLADFVVSDMGGTTTDVAVVRGGHPVVSAEGAAIGGWRTMVEAVDVHTCGLGGDSSVQVAADASLRVGPRRVMPLSLLARQFPAVLEPLRLLAATERPPPGAAQFAWRNPGREAPPLLDPIERRVWSALEPAPRALHDVARTSQGAQALQRLVDRGLATLAGFTPSDAMHVLGSQQDWDIEAARLGAGVLAVEQRNAGALAQALSPEALSEAVREQVVRQATRAVLESALAQDPGIEAPGGRWGALAPLLDQVIAGKPFSHLLDARLQLASPLVAIGAPVAGYYPEIARRLGCALHVPEHAAVCNAVGAVAGVVSEVGEVLVNQPSFNLFRVHDPAGSRDHDDVARAIADATGVSRALALAAALRAGAVDPHVETQVLERRARGSVTGEYVAEALVRSRATGRPASRPLVLVA